MDLPTTIAAFREMSRAWPQAHAKYVEDKANGPVVMQTLKHEMAGLIRARWLGTATNPVR